jgi:hypothetical protein
VGAPLPAFASAISSQVLSAPAPLFFFFFSFFDGAAACSVSHSVGSPVVSVTTFGITSVLQVSLTPVLLISS